jgi:hypothetical protein
MKKYSQSDSVESKLGILQFLSKWLQHRTDVIIPDESLSSSILIWFKHLEITSELENIIQKLQLCLNQFQLEKPLSPKTILHELRANSHDDSDTCPIQSIYLTSINLEKGEIRDLFDFNPMAIAKQMALHDSLLIKRIQNYEWLGQGWMKQKAPNICAVINRFNEISNWTSTMIVIGATKEIRAMAIVHLVLVATACLELHNFHAVLALVTGLSSTPVSRLLQTWKDVDSDTTRCLDKLKELISINSKFKGLREAQESVEGPCVPYLGVYLNDLTFIEDGNLTKLNDQLINYEKIQMLSNVILKLKKLTSTTYNFRNEEAIQGYLHHPPRLSEDEIFEESLKREGREENIELYKNTHKPKRKKTVLNFILPEY